MGVKLYTGKCGDVEDPAYRATTTGASGEYFFAMLYAGDYCLVVDESTLPAGYVPSVPLSPLDVHLNTSEIIDTADFGYASAYADDRLTVGAYAPCSDISWLQTHAVAHSASFLNEDYEACSFTLGATGADMAGLQTAVSGDSNTRRSENDVFATGAQTPGRTIPTTTTPTMSMAPSRSTPRRPGV